MSKTGRTNYRRTDRERKHHYKPEKRIVVQENQRSRLDLRKLSRAMIAMGMQTTAPDDEVSTNKELLEAAENNPQEANHDNK